VVTGYKNAKFVQSPFMTKGRPSWVKSQGVMWIIIHGTASGIAYPAADTARDFQTNRGASTHYIVGYDGSVYQCVDENDTAWGNGPITGAPGKSVQGGGSPTAQHDSWWDTVAKGDCNSCTISIEHSKSTDNMTALSDAQKAASFALIADIISRWGKYIPVQLATSTGGITGHYSMDPVNRSFCPGPYPWSDLISYLSGHPVSGVSGNEPTQPPTSGETSTATTPAGASGGGQTYTTLLAQVHSTLTNNGGFESIALTLDEAEQFPGWIDLTDTWSAGPWTVPDPLGIIRSIGATVTDNFVPFIVRSGLVSLGLLLLILLLVRLVMDSGALEAVQPLIESM
jgi:N-acetylmuramoyl-L-alanine amidase-like protein